MEGTTLGFVILGVVVAFGALLYARSANNRAKRASIVVTFPSWGMGTGAQVCSLVVNNGGPAVATNVCVRSRNEDGLDVSTPTPASPPTILPGGHSTASVEVSAHLLSPSLDVWVAWDDEEGRHDESILRLPPPHGL